MLPTHKKTEVLSRAVHPNTGQYSNRTVNPNPGNYSSCEISACGYRLTNTFENCSLRIITLYIYLFYIQIHE